MTSATLAQRAADKHALEFPHLFFSAPFWKDWDHVRCIRDVRDECGTVVLAERPIPIREIMPFYGRDVAWTDLPVIGAPRFRLRIDPTSELAAEGLTTAVANARLATQQLIAYDENTQAARCRPAQTAYNRAVFGFFCRENFPDKQIAIRRAGKRNLFERSYPGTRHEELVAEAGGTVHLEYNYAFNGMALLKPIMAAYMKPNVGADEDSRLRKGWLSRHVADFYLRFGHSPIYRYPMYLQFMFALLDAAAEERRALYGWFIDASVKVSLSGVYRDGSWLGSGKYAPFPAGQTFESCMTALHGLGLIEILHAEKEVRLSSNAIEMLACFHKANRDPDIISRFATAGSADIPVSETDRIDSCLTRFFRKFKANNGGR